MIEKYLKKVLTNPFLGAIIVTSKGEIKMYLLERIRNAKDGSYFKGDRIYSERKMRGWRVIMYIKKDAFYLKDY